MTRPVPAAWCAAIAAYLQAMIAGGSPATTRATRRAQLRRAGRCLGGSPWGVSTDQLVTWCAGQSWAIETRRSMRASLRGFYSWGVASGLCAESPADGLPSVRPADPVPRPAPEIVVHEALRRADERTALMVRCAAEIGLRRAEVAGIHRRDLADDLTGRTLTVRGKGGRVRYVPLPDSLAAAMVRRFEQHGRGYLFPGDDGGHLSARYVGKLVAAVLPGDWTMHALRHRFATRAYSACRDTFAVQSLLGHASPVTTRRYVAVPADGLRAVVDAVA